MGYFNSVAMEGIVLEEMPATEAQTSDNQSSQPISAAEVLLPAVDNDDGADADAAKEGADADEDADADEGADTDEGADADEGADTGEDAAREEGAVSDTDGQSAAEARREFEEKENKRKAEWMVKQALKLTLEANAVKQVAEMSPDDRSIAAADRLSKEFEMFSRMELKSYLTQQVQMKCYEDPEFAKAALHPRKSFGNCLRYINRKVYEYFKQERKDTGELPCDGDPALGMYGFTVAINNELCAQWAEEYYRDPFAREDLSKDEEFKPETYRPEYRAAGKSGKKKPTEKKPVEKTAAMPKPPKAKPAVDDRQMSLLETA